MKKSLDDLFTFIETATRMELSALFVTCFDIAYNPECKSIKNISLNGDEYSLLTEDDSDTVSWETKAGLLNAIVQADNFVSGIPEEVWEAGFTNDNFQLLIDEYKRHNTYTIVGDEDAFNNPQKYTGVEIKLNDDGINYNDSLLIKELGYSHKESSMIYDCQLYKTTGISVTFEKQIDDLICQIQIEDNRDPNTTIRFKNSGVRVVSPEDFMIFISKVKIDGEHQFIVEYTTYKEICAIKEIVDLLQARFPDPQNYGLFNKKIIL